MKITYDQVRYVADLARLEMDEAALEAFSRQIGEILEYIGKLNEVDTEGVSSTSHAISLTNAFREDEPSGHIGTERALANAPERDDESFLVPKVIS